MAAETLKDKRFVERALATTPLQKVATPEDVARQIAVLASPVLSGHMTGVNVQVGEYDLPLPNLVMLMCLRWWYGRKVSVSAYTLLISCRLRKVAEVSNAICTCAEGCC